MSRITIGLYCWGHAESEKRRLQDVQQANLGIRTIVIDARVESNFARGLTNELSSPQTALNIQADATIPHLPLSMGDAYTKTLQTQSLDQLLSSVKKEILVIVDEVQWLKNPRSVAMLLAHIFDYHYEKMTFIITGSSVGGYEDNYRTRS